MVAPAFNRILLKLSGEALMGDQTFGIDQTVVENFATQISQARTLGVEVCVVIGGGNIFRGMAVAAKGGDRVTGDHLGMLATIMNALALKNGLDSIDVPCVVVSAVAMPAICETFTQRGAMKHIQSGKVVIFAGGTGNPFFTTDTGAALRAAEMKCDAILKGTQVDGVYTSDPRKDPAAKRFDHVSHQQVLEDGLAVMDATAIALAQDNMIPIVVFLMHSDAALETVLKGEGTFTTVSGN
ncbi:MAG: UMP kinase [Cohaesibacteraceae bacterium]|nr:UMP kinase [Cohaesibacteraceae bacterium]